MLPFSENVTKFFMTQEPETNEKFINLGIVLNKSGEALMIRRVKEEDGKDGSKLTWAFPGGKQRKDESREQCAQREIKDETGYDIKPVRQISLRVHPGFMILIAYHLCELNSETQVSEPIEPHEVAEVKWVKLNEIENIITSDLDPKVKRELGLDRQSAPIVY
jgi:ADP-ribose pyrophosphatase YjhB (NUDIX family)